MKTPDEIKRWLKGCNDKSNCSWCPNSYQCDRDADTLAYIQQLESQVPKWISVEEQPEPPEDDVYYCYGYWIGSGRKQAETAEYAWGEWKIENNFVLTHWMPLPEPPKEEAEC